MPVLFDGVPGTPQNAAHSMYKEEMFIPWLGVRQCGDLSQGGASQSGRP